MASVSSLAIKIQTGTDNTALLLSKSEAGSMSSRDRNGITEPLSRASYLAAVLGK